MTVHCAGLGPGVGMKGVLLAWRVGWALAYVAFDTTFEAET